MLNVVSEQQPPLPAADGSSLEEQSRSGADCWPSYIGPDDLRPLTGPGQWLGDAVVNTVMRIIVAQRPHLRTLDSTYLTTGHSNLRGRTGSSSSDVTVAKAEGLHDSGIGILLPLNLSNQHWVLGCLEVDKKRADVWDPLPSEEHTLAATDLISQFVSRYLPESISSWCEWDHYSFRSIRQHNAYDCGVYILATASFYAADLEMPGSIQVEDWRRLFLTLLPREQPSVSVPPTQCLSPTPSSTTTLECQSSTSIPATPPAESHRVSSSASMQPRLVTAIDATIDVPFTVPTQPPLVIGSTGREDPRMHIQWCSQMLSLGLEAAKDNVRRTRAAVKGRIETIEPIRQVVKILTERGRVELVRLEREMAGSSSASKPLRQYLRRRHMAATAWQRRIGDVGIDAALVYLDARLMELDADDEEIDRFVFFP
ncbi:hypothetical protein VTK73DRAFT_984 [Phialemonium thermophilum]|uniref:Ubiquitin-like protease family profile domain-containing protein n=1 Tax=Phialemonium thermophilum TaxID=223376 RepID=A0ABR3XCT1_9PEZI